MNTRTCYRVMRGGERIADIYPKVDREDVIERYRQLYRERDGYMIVKIEAVMPVHVPATDNKSWVSRHIHDVI